MTLELDLRGITYLNKVLQAVSLEEVKNNLGAELSSLILNELALGDGDNWRHFHNAVCYNDKLSDQNIEIKAGSESISFWF